jgi:hypothetical protein
MAFWQFVAPTTTKMLERGWKIEIPFDQVVGRDAAGKLADLAEGPPYIQRLNQLAHAKPWMELLQNGEELFVEATSGLIKAWAEAV